MKILFLDDDLNAIEGFVDLLRANKHEVDDVGSVTEGREKLKSNDYAVLILDIMFPLGDKTGSFTQDQAMNAGVALLEELKSGKFGRNQQTRVIVYTAKKSDTSLPAKLTALGVSEDDIYYRPGNYREIIRILGEVPRG
jgi:DNA-binding response OmpR family regulator